MQAGMGRDCTESQAAAQAQRETVLGRAGQGGELALERDQGSHRGVWSIPLMGRDCLGAVQSREG